MSILPPRKISPGQSKLMIDADKAQALLKKGKIAVIPTDTIYGIVGLALNPQAVEKIYSLRKRAKDKPMIILISSLDDLKLFDVHISDQTRNILKKLWPNPVSVILPVQGEKFRYLHRGKNSLAFRMPRLGWLLRLLKKVGPVVAPSANIEGEIPAQTIDQAKSYFGEQIDYYLDGGKLDVQPSTLVQIDGQRIKVLRQGSFSI